MSDEERAREIAVAAQAEDGPLGYEWSEDEEEQIVEMIAAALREARTEGGRKMQQEVAKLLDKNVGRWGGSPDYALAKMVASVLALDPAEVVR